MSYGQDDGLKGSALYLHSINCADGCGECRGRQLTTSEARQLRDDGVLGANGPRARVEEAHDREQQRRFDATGGLMFEGADQADGY